MALRAHGTTIGLHLRGTGLQTGRRGGTTIYCPTALYNRSAQGHGFARGLRPRAKPCPCAALAWRMHLLLLAWHNFADGGTRRKLEPVIERFQQPLRTRARLCARPAAARKAALFQTPPKASQSKGTMWFASPSEFKLGFVPP